MQPVRSLALAIALSLAGGCAQLPGTGAVVSAQKYTAMSFQVSVKGAQVRRVLTATDPISAVDASNVKTVIIRLVDTAVGESSATEARVENFDAAASSVTFTNLAYGRTYKITCKAYGTDPNGADPADEAADLTDANADLSTAYLAVPDLVDGSGDQNVKQYLEDADGNPVSALPLALYTPIFKGHAQTGIGVATGEVASTDEDVVVTGGHDMAIALASDTQTVDRMGFWNHLVDDPNDGSNTNRGQDTHLRLKLYNMTPGSRITKIRILATGPAFSGTREFVTTAYPGPQVIGMYKSDNTSRAAVGASMAVDTAHTELNLYIDAPDYGLSAIPAGSEVDVEVTTQAGTSPTVTETLNDVTL